MNNVGKLPRATTFLGTSGSVREVVSCCRDKAMYVLDRNAALVLFETRDKITLILAVVDMTISKATLRTTSTELRKTIYRMILKTKLIIHDINGSKGKASDTNRGDQRTNLLNKRNKKQKAVLTKRSTHSSMNLGCVLIWTSISTPLDCRYMSPVSKVSTYSQGPR